MSEKLQSEVENVTKLTLIKMGVRSDLIGFQYLTCAVRLVVEEPNLIHNLCGGLYVRVGQVCNITAIGCVERSIRHVIENTYINRGFTSLNKMFNTNIYSVKDKPTAGELINLLAEYYKLGLYKTSSL
ncbi:MAG: sporulation initiation factor Spo0A C-terminal domain-containing protein [Clostridia bacterium]|nr:sporulation initiation factor Spo0A C-terminal domain-containing protein [Clostridia bacterium]